MGKWRKGRPQVGDYIKFQEKDRLTIKNTYKITKVFFLVESKKDKKYTTINYCDVELVKVKF